MRDIKFGLKLWSTNSNLLEKAEGIVGSKFQYVELTLIPKKEIAPFLDYNFLYIIHMPTAKHGLNIADEKKKKFNLKTINSCIEWADRLNAKYIILHPGFGLIEATIEFLDQIDDKRILIENMPKVGLNNEHMVGYTSEQIQRLLNNRFGFCLDFGHAIKAATSLKKDYKKYIDRFLRLNPTLIHISDGKLCSEKDEHLAVGEGNYDFEFLMNCVKKSGASYLTLETPKMHLDSLNEDLENLEKLKSMINPH